MKKIGIILCCLLITASAFAQSDSQSNSQTQTQPKKRRKKSVIQQADDNISGQSYGTAGCGLGSILFGAKPGLIQILAATSNGSSGNQTFGISSGTSNCTTDAAQGERSASLFIVVNREILAKDISRGNGEALDSLSEIMGCTNSRALGSKLQQNFNAIFPSQKASSEGSSKTIFQIIKGDAQLSKSCAKIG